MSAFIEDDEAYARRVVDGLLELDQPMIELRDDLVVSDIEDDAAEFAEELRLARRFGFEIPAVRVGHSDVAPVSLSLAMGAAAWPNFPRFPREPYLSLWVRRNL